MLDFIKDNTFLIDVRKTVNYVNNNLIGPNRYEKVLLSNILYFYRG